jgi:hypothetical protein
MNQKKNDTILTKKRKKRIKKPMESSKKIVLYCDSILAICVTCTIIGFFSMLDISEMVKLVQVLAGLSAACHGFYFWKAKNENMKKFGANCTDSIIDNLSNNDNMQGGIM